MSAAFISRFVATRKGSSWVTLSGRGSAGEPVRVRLKSRLTTEPEATVTVAACACRPVKVTTILASPAGTGARRKSPLSPVNASSVVPGTVRRALLRYAPLVALSTRPSTVPVGSVLSAARVAVTGASASANQPAIAARVDFIFMEFGEECASAVGLVSAGGRSAAG